MILTPRDRAANNHTRRPASIASTTRCAIANRRCHLLFRIGKHPVYQINQIQPIFRTQPLDLPIKLLHSLPVVHRRAGRHRQQPSFAHDFFNRHFERASNALSGISAWFPATSYDS